VEKLRDGHATTLGAASGAVAGLVAITPAAGFVSPMGSIAVGIIAGTCCSLATTLKYRLGFDDSLDVVAVHLLGGVLGALTIGLFGDAHFGGVNGVFRGGGWTLMGHQALAAGVVVAYSFSVSFALGKLIGVFMKNRLHEDHEVAGMDITQHGETAYEFGAVRAGNFVPSALHGGSSPARA